MLCDRWHECIVHRHLTQVANALELDYEISHRIDSIGSDQATDIPVDPASYAQLLVRKYLNY